MGTLESGIVAFSKQLKQDLDETFRYTLFELSKKVINTSPVDEGRFRSNWFASAGNPIRRTVKTNRRDPLKNLNEKVLKAVQNGKLYYLTNNLDYANIIEYGLYPKNPKLGTRVRGSRPARYEIRSKNGYSRQAPKGVLRINILKQKKVFENYLNSDKIKTGGSGKNWS